MVAWGGMNKKFIPVLTPVQRSKTFFGVSEWLCIVGEGSIELPVYFVTCVRLSAIDNARLQNEKY